MKTCLPLPHCVARQLPHLCDEDVIVLLRPPPHAFTHQANPAASASVGRALSARSGDTLQLAQASTTDSALLHTSSVAAPAAATTLELSLTRDPPTSATSSGSSARQYVDPMDDPAASREGGCVHHCVMLPPAGIARRLQSFVCHTKPDADTRRVNFNKPLTDALTELASFYELGVEATDVYRASNLRKTIEFFRRLRLRIDSEATLNAVLADLAVRRPAYLNSIAMGDSTRKKLEEWLTTGQIDKLTGVRASPILRAKAELMQVHGIGPVKATKLVQPPYNVRDVNDLYTRVYGTTGTLQVHDHVTKQLEVDTLACLKVHADLASRIPRDEVLECVQIVERACEVVYAPGAMRVYVCGSGRRGAATSGDVDILVTPRTQRGFTPDLNPLLAHLTRTGFLLDVLRGNKYHKEKPVAKRVAARGEDTEEDAEPDKDKTIVMSFSHSLTLAKERLIAGVKPEGVDMPVATPDDLERMQWVDTSVFPHVQCMGLCRARERVRRIDIKAYPRDTLPFAIMYFTGSDYFNRSVRAYVNRCGWTLSDTGLKPCVRDRFRTKTADGWSLKCETEADIFRACGVPYRTPPQRDFKMQEVDAASISRVELRPALAATHVIASAVDDAYESIDLEEEGVDQGEGDIASGAGDELPLSSSSRTSAVAAGRGASRGGRGGRGMWRRR